MNKQEYIENDNRKKSLLHHPLRIEKLTESLEKLPTILPIELDGILEDTSIILQTAAECQSSGRLEESCVLLRQVYSTILAMQNHREVYQTNVKIIDNQLQNTNEYYIPLSAKQYIDRQRTRLGMYSLIIIYYYI